jgi:hypothetical protein
MKKKAFLLFALSILGLITLYALTVITVPRPSPSDLTRKRMFRLEALIEDFVLQNKKIPDDLQFVKANQALNHLTVDGWGSPIQYKVISNNIILTSNGDDKEPSQIWRFSIKEEQGAYRDIGTNETFRP